MDFRWYQALDSTHWRGGLSGIFLRRRSIVYSRRCHQETDFLIQNRGGYAGHPDGAQALGMRMEDLLGPSRRIPRNWRGAFPQHCPGPHKAPIQARFQYTATLLIRGLFNHPQLTSLRCWGNIFFCQQRPVSFLRNSARSEFPIVANGENVCAERLSVPNSTARWR